MSDTIRLALVGCGGISNSHVKGYRELMERGCREFTVTACCDVVQERAEERASQIAAFQGTEPRIFSTVQALITAECADAADVCVPHYAHHTVGIALMEAGFHVLVEKPVGITIRATQRMMKAARRHGRLLATAEQVRRGQKARACRWAICEHKLIGDVRTVVVQAIDNNDFDYSKDAFRWRGIKMLVGGGMIMDSGAHFADMIQHLFGNVDTVSCSMSTQESPLIEQAPLIGTAPVDVEDTWHAVITFKEGPLVTWTYSRTSPGEPLRQAVYYGSKGSMRDLGFPFHCFQGGGEAHLANGSVIPSGDIVDAYMATLTPDQQERLFPYGCTHDIGIEVWDFVHAIRTGEEPEMDAEAGLRAKTLCEACFESSTVGHAVTYDDVLRGHIREFQRPIDDYWDL